MRGVRAPRYDDVLSHNAWNSPNVPTPECAAFHRLRIASDPTGSSQDAGDGDAGDGESIRVTTNA
jgi:hypothetical protein